MSNQPKVPVLYELDENREATGTVLWFCSDECRSRTGAAPQYAEGNDDQYPAGTVCQRCCTALPATHLLPIHTLAEFQEALKLDRISAIRWLMFHKVEEWMNDGQDEVVRCLTCWAEQGINLGDDEALSALALGVLD